MLGPHWTRGFTGEFGAPRSGGRVHEGFDVVAACRTPLVAAVTGRVLRAGYDPVLYGNHLLIHGQGERRSYFYAHLTSPAAVRRGDRVWAGEPVGTVGKTGNARSVGCHLHFEIHSHGHPIDPEPALSRWIAAAERRPPSRRFVCPRVSYWHEIGANSAPLAQDRLPQCPPCSEGDCLRGSRATWSVARS